MKRVSGELSLTIKFFDVEIEDDEEITIEQAMDAWNDGNAESWYEEFNNIKEEFIDR